MRKLYQKMVACLPGEKKLIIENDQPWEAHLAEEMWVTRHNNTYYLFYSGNDFSTEQIGIGVTIADGPFGLFKKILPSMLKSTINGGGPVIHQALWALMAKLFIHTCHFSE